MYVCVCYVTRHRDNILFAELLMRKATEVEGCAYARYGLRIACVIDVTTRMVEVEARAVLFVRKKARSKEMIGSLL